MGEWRYSALDGGEWSARHPPDRRLGGPQSRSGSGGEEKKYPIIAPARNRTPVTETVSHFVYWL